MLKPWSAAATPNFGPSAFDAASQFVREEDMSGQVPYGPDPQLYVDMVLKWADARFTELAFVQIGSDQAAFCDWFAATLRPAMD